MTLQLQFQLGKRGHGAHGGLGGKVDQRIAADFPLNLGDDLQRNRAFISRGHLSQIPFQIALGIGRSRWKRLYESRALRNAVNYAHVVSGRIARIAYGDHKGRWLANLNFLRRALLNHHVRILGAIQVAVAGLIADQSRQRGGAQRCAFAIAWRLSGWRLSEC